MAGKKGRVPAHIKKKQFSHPGIDYPFITILESIEDPRQPSVFFSYSLTSVLYRVGARNLAVLRKMALHALLKDTTMKGGIATKQCAAACNPAYRSKVIKNLF